MQLDLQGFIRPAPDPPPQTRDEPQARINDPPNQPQKIWHVREVYKMKRVLEEGRENG